MNQEQQLRILGISAGVLILLSFALYIVIAAHDAGDVGPNGPRGSEGKIGGVNFLLFAFNKDFNDEITQTETVPISLKANGEHTVPDMLISNVDHDTYPFSQETKGNGTDKLPGFVMNKSGMYQLTVGMSCVTDYFGSTRISLIGKNDVVHPNDAFVNLSGARPTSQNSIIFHHDITSQYGRDPWTLGWNNNEQKITMPLVKTVTVKLELVG